MEVKVETVEYNVHKVSVNLIEPHLAELAAETKEARDQAVQAAVGAKVSENNASVSAEGAKVSETKAAVHAKEASDIAVASATYAEIAESHKNSAALSADAARASESNAKDSEAIAENSAVSSGESAVKAKEEADRAEETLSSKADEINQDGKIVRGVEVINKDYKTIIGISGGAGSGYYRKYDGVISALATRKVIKWDNISPSKKYVISGTINGSNDLCLAVFFDINGVFIGKYLDVPTNETFDRKMLDVPQNTYSIGSGNGNHLPDLVLEEVLDEVSYKKALFEGDVYSKQEVDSRIPKSPLNGKRIGEFGDSIMLGGADNIGPVDMVSRINNMVISRYSVGGATISNVIGSVNNIMNQIDKAVSEGKVFDYIVFNGMTNDISGSSSVQLGDISVGYFASLDKNKFSGALEYILKTIKATWPSAKVLYVRVHKMGSRSEDKQNEFGSRAVSICNKWAVPVCDLYNNSGLLAYVPNIVKLYTVATTTQPDGDKTHPNDLGYRTWYDGFIERSLNSI